MADFGVELHVSQLETEVEFFRRVLGMSCVQAKPGFVEMTDGSAVIMLCPIEGERNQLTPFTASTDGAKGVGVEIVIAVADLDGTAARCREFGIFATPIVLTPWRRHEFIVRLPDGYVLRIVEAGRRRNSKQKEGKGDIK